MYCSECHAPLPEGGIYCPQCGKQMGKANNPLMLVAVVLLAVSVLLVSFLMLKGTIFGPAIPKGTVSSDEGQMHNGTEIIDGNLQFRVESDGGMTVIGYVDEPKGDLIVPATVEGQPVVAIADEAFSFCDEITALILPDSIERIGMGAFCGCDGLRTLQLPANLKTIGEMAFQLCSNLTEVVFPEGLRSIGYGAFADCTSLAVAKLPDSLEYVDSTVFKGCAAELQLAVPGMESEGNLLYELRAEGAAITGYVEQPVGELVIPATLGGKPVYMIEAFTFQGCEEITAVTIPASVKTIGFGAFQYCSKLAVLQLNEGLDMIVDCAFYDCDVLESVVLPDSVTVIGAGAFSYCPKLSMLILPENLEYVGNAIIDGCDALTLLGYRGSQERWHSIQIEDGNELMEAIGIRFDYKD